MMYSLRNVFLSMSLAGLLSGCVAAAVPAYYAASLAGTALTGFALFKTFQLSTGGEAKVEFEKRPPSSEDRSIIRSASSMAVWPVKGGEGYFVDQLSQRTGLRVVSPGKVRRWVNEQKYERDPALLSAEDRYDYTRRLARKFGVDLVLMVTTATGLKTKGNTWSLSRAKAEQELKVAMYSPKREHTVWAERMRIIVEIGDETPSTDEMSELAEKAIAERLSEIL